MNGKITPELIAKTTLFADLVGDNIFELIVHEAPTKIASRLAKALQHFEKAAYLKGVDDEMGAIRLIAAEEEIVVAIFEWLKINASAMPEHADFIKKSKNHRVKLAFYPVLSQLRFILGPMLLHGLTLEGLENALHFNIEPVRVGNKILLRVTDQDKKS